MCQASLVPRTLPAFHCLKRNFVHVWGGLTNEGIPSYTRRKQRSNVLDSPYSVLCSIDVALYCHFFLVGDFNIRQPPLIL